MALNFFPHQRDAAVSSKYPSVLRYHRIVSFIILILSFLYNIIFSDFDPLGIEISTMLTSLAFEVLAILTYRNSDLNKITCLVFVVSWAFASALELTDLLFIGRHGIFDVVFFVPWLVLFVDYLLNRISVLRIQYIFPITLIIIYVVFIPNMLDVMFHMFSTFEIILTYLFILGLTVIVLEISRVAKVGSCKETGTVEQHLL
jgi:hypothetical protein